MANIVGNDSDNLLRGTNTRDTLRGVGGNDILEGLNGADTLLGGKDNDQLFGGIGSDVLSGDGETSPTNLIDKGDDFLIGGSGSDTLIAWGDDVLVGGGPNTLNANFITDLGNDPFATPVQLDGNRDTFVAINQDALSYTLTIVDYEVGIDRIDLSDFGVLGASDFVEIQDKGDFFEAKSSDATGATLTLRINADPALLTYLA